MLEFKRPGSNNSRILCLLKFRTYICNDVVINKTVGWYFLKTTATKLRKVFSYQHVRTGTKTERLVART